MESRAQEDRDFGATAAHRVADSLFLAGRYTECIALCESACGTEHEIFRRQSLLRLRRYDDAIRGVREALGRAALPGERARLAGCAAIAMASSGSVEEARSVLHAVRPDVEQLDVARRLEFDCDRALVAWISGDNGNAEALLREAERGDDSGVRGRAKILRSWVLARKGRYVEQSVLLADGIRALDAAAAPDIGMIARAVHALSALVREMHLPHAMGTVSSFLKRLPWTDDLQYEHFQTLRNVGWTCALQANYIGGLRSLDAAKQRARGEYQRLLARLDHAVVARIAGERLTFEAGLLDCAESLDSLDATTSSEETMVLVVAAETLAPLDRKRAIAALRSFDRVRTEMSGAFVLSADPQTDAMYRYASAVIALHQGRKTKAAAESADAFQTFHDMGFAWRAARCALVAYRATGDDHWLEKAAGQCRPYPRSFIAAEIVALSDAKRHRLEQSALTLRQREIAVLLAQGLTVEETARRLKASANTVKVHKNRIYHALGVRNRVELARETAKIAI